MITELPRRRIRVRPLVIVIAILFWIALGSLGWLLGRYFGIW